MAIDDPQIKLLAASRHFGDEDLAHAVSSYRQATSARRVARAVPGAGPVARRLAGGRTAHLMDTLETYLDLAGDAARTAAALRIHRTMLYYRLGRAEQVAGIDLRDGPTGSPSTSG